MSTQDKTTVCPLLTEQKYTFVGYMPRGIFSLKTASNDTPREKIK